MESMRSRLLGTFVTFEDAFYKLAVDGERIDWSMFEEGMSQLQDPVPTAQASFSFHTLDLNFDGGVDQDEFFRSLRPVEDEGGSNTMTPSKWLELFEREAGPTFSSEKWIDFAFGLLDGDSDGSCNTDEFATASQRFVTPVTKAQGSTVFFQMDTDRDGALSKVELLAAAEDRLDAKLTESVLTLSEYRERINGGASGVAGVEIRISKASVKDLSKFTLNSIKKILVLTLSDAAGTPTTSIFDESGAAETVLLAASDAPTVALNASFELQSERRLDDEEAEGAEGAEGAEDAEAAEGAEDAEGAVVARAIVHYSEASSADSEKLAAAARKKLGDLAVDLSKVTSFLTSDKGLKAEDFQVSPITGPRLLFAVGNTDGDQTLSSTEFQALPGKMRQTMTGRQAKFAFDCLDSDFDGNVTISEFMGEGHFANPAFLGRQLPMDGLLARMSAKYETPQDGFDSMAQDMSGQADQSAVSGFGKSLTPPLSDDQATWIFHGMDVDGSGFVSNVEFLQVIKIGKFWPSATVLRDMFSRKYISVDKYALTPMIDDGGSTLALALACYLLGAYFVRSLFVAFCLPGGLGIVLGAAGAAWLGLVPAAMVEAQKDLMEAASYLFLFVAGFGISFGDLGLCTFLRAMLPAIAEVIGIAAYSVLALDLPILQALLLGTALAGAGEAPAVARMHGLAPRFEGHSLPRLIATWLPIETCFLLIQWGVLAVAAQLSTELSSSSDGSGSDKGQDHPAKHYASIAAAAGLCIGASLLGGLLVGVLIGKLLAWRTWNPCCGRRAFSGSSAEAAVLVFGIVMAGLCAATFDLQPLISEVKVEGSRLRALSPELLLLAGGIGLAMVISARDLDAVDAGAGGLWLFGQIALLGSVGFEAGGFSSGGWGTEKQLLVIAPMMGIGLLLRFCALVVGNAFAFCAPACRCSKCRKAARTSLLADAVFGVFASMPRTNMQAFFICSSMAKHQLTAVSGSTVLRGIVPVAARAYIVVFSVIGAWLLEILGPCLLSAGSGICDKTKAEEREKLASGWTQRQRTLLGYPNYGAKRFFRIGLVSDDGLVVDDPGLPAYPAKQAAGLLAKALLVDTDAFATMMSTTGAGGDAGGQSKGCCSTSEADHDPFASTTYTGYASIRDMSIYQGGNRDEEVGNDEQMAKTTGERTSGTVARRLAEECAAPMSLLEATGGDADGAARRQSDDAGPGWNNRRI